MMLHLWPQDVVLEVEFEGEVSKFKLYHVRCSYSCIHCIPPQHFAVPLQTLGVAHENMERAVVWLVQMAMPCTYVASVLLLAVLYLTMNHFFPNLKLLVQCELQVILCVMLYNVGVASSSDETCIRETSSQLSSPHRTKSARCSLPVSLFSHYTLSLYTISLYTFT